MRKVSIEKKIQTFCADCPEEPEKCGYNPRDCMMEAKIYFELYDLPAFKSLGIKQGGRL